MVLPNHGADSKPNRCCQGVGQQEPESRFCPFMDSGRPFRSAGPLDRGEGRDDARPRTRLRPGRGCARGPGSLGSGSVRHPGQQAALGPPGKASRSLECGLKDTRRQGLKAGGPVQSVHGYFYLPGLAAVFTPPLPGPGSGQGVRAHAFPHVSSCCRSTALL